MTRRALRENVFTILFQYDFFSSKEMDRQIKLYLNGSDQEQFSD